MKNNGVKKNISRVYKKIDTYFKQSLMLFCIVLFVFLILFFIFTYINLLHTADIWLRLFEKRIYLVDNEISDITHTSHIDAVSSFIISEDGMIIQSLPERLTDINVMSSGMFERILHIKEGEIILMFYPDLADSILRIYFAKKIGGKYHIATYDAETFLPEITVSGINLVISSNNVVWYSTINQWIGNLISPALLLYLNNNIYLSTTRVLDKMPKMRITIYQNITRQLIFAFLSIVFIVVFFIMFTIKSKKVRDNFRSLDSEQIKLYELIKKLSSSPEFDKHTIENHITNQINLYNKIVEIIEHMKKEFVFAENYNYLDLLQKYIIERTDAEKSIQTFITEKITLLREVYHRTKNNMAVICSMLEFEKEKYDNERIVMVLGEMINRIQTMALVHKKLYQAKNLSSIDLSEYTTELIQMLLNNYSRGDYFIDFTHNCDTGISVTIDTAVPCGLIVNEIISNSLKHGVYDSKNIMICLTIKRLPDHTINLTLSDNGNGVSSNFDFKKNSRMGLQTIYAIGETQLDGKINFVCNNGVTFNFTFTNDYEDEYSGEYIAG